MGDEIKGYRVCLLCGGTFSEESDVCPHCEKTSARIPLISGRGTELWGSPSSESTADSEPRVIPSFGRYKDLEFIGRGGMGRVYKATDPGLNRTVALKFIRGDDPDLSRRLLTEARLQARMEHEHVCKVYEVGDVDGRLYISMQYLRGKSLNTVAPEMNLLQKVSVIKRVAEAVHEAHRAGLIHRDLKPANIMVERSEQGDWIPFVMDFGLARVQESAGMTASGLVVGSPHYMSPEQARGEITTLDRRSDVYSLGVTLYEVLCGSRPFDDESSSIQVILKVLYNDPPPLRKKDPSLPGDLETIVMKCLEKDPERRYASARALAEDLSRFMDGDPIAARPTGFFYRIRKKAAKNKVLTAVIAGSAMVVLLSLAAVVRAQLQAREQARLAQRFGIEVKEIESMLRNAHTMPLHNISRERALVLERMKRIEAQTVEVGSAGYGPCHYALGRGYLALQDVERAARHLQLAWEAGYRDSAVGYALGQALGILYDREQERVKHLGSQKEAALVEIRKKYREPALQHLKMSRDSVSDPPAYVEGLIAFYDSRYEEALQDAAKAVQEVPWLYEAKKLEGDIYLMRGADNLDSGKHDLAASDFQAAGSAYEEAIDMARSDPALYVSRCAQGILTLELEMARGDFPEPVLQEAVAACDSALLALPEQADAWEKKSWAYFRWGEFQSLSGHDPQQTLLSAIDFGKRATRNNPKLLEAWIRLGSAYNTLGEYEMNHGVDPRPNLQQAMTCSREIFKIDPNHPYASNLLGYAALTIAEYEIANALDPRASLDEAIRGFEKTTRIDPKFAKGFNNLAYTYLTRGMYEMEHGLDARASFEKAIQGFQDAIRVNPGYAAAYGSLGMTRIRLAQFELQNGRDPLPFLDEARKDCNRALELNPQYAYAFNTLGLTYLVSAQHKLQQWQDPSSDVDQAVSALQKSLEYKPDGENARVNRVRIQLVKGEWELRSGFNPAATIRDARGVLSTLTQINRNLTPILAASLDLLEARSNATRGKSPLPLLENAAKVLGEPMNSEGYELLAEVFTEKARWEKKHNMDFSASVRSAIAAADSALKINPARAKSKALRDALQSQ